MDTHQLDTVDRDVPEGRNRAAAQNPTERRHPEGMLLPVTQTAIDGLLIVKWETFDDDRGFFRQTYVTSELETALGRTLQLRQGNHARSGPGVLRGFHAEPWDKLVYVVRGTVYAAFADIRPESETFGRVVTVELGDPPGVRRRVFLPNGVANAYCVVGTESADYLYEVTAEWTPSADKRAVAWNDPDLAVDWPVAAPTLSTADLTNPTLRERFPSHPRLTGPRDR